MTLRPTCLLPVLLLTLGACALPEAERLGNLPAAVVSSGLEYDVPYVAEGSNGFGVSRYRYVFHRDGICDYSKRSQNPFSGSWGEWQLQLSSAPFELKGASVLVDWASCTPNSTCASLGGNDKDEVLEIESNGLKLTVRTNGEEQTYIRESN